MWLRLCDSLQRFFRRLASLQGQCSCSDGWRTAHSRAARHKRRDAGIDEVDDGVNGEAQKLGIVVAAVDKRKPAVDEASRQLGGWFFIGEINALRLAVIWLEPLRFG